MKGKNKPPVLFWIEDQDPRGPFHYKSKNSFYASPPWRRLREYKLLIDPFCERCKERDEIVPAEEVHHIVEISVDPDRALEYDNLESLCKTCHSKESAKFLKEKPKGEVITYATKHLKK